MSDASISDEFKKATSYELTDEDIERAKLLLNYDLASRDQQITVANRVKAASGGTYAQWGCGWAA